MRHQWSMAGSGGRLATPRLDAQAIFNRLDTNKDGKLSFEEFSAGLQKFQQRMANKRHDGAVRRCEGRKPGLQGASDRALRPRRP